jgi:sulfatase maturation enzyme AslB (radical SAM superfamily)
MAADDKRFKNQLEENISFYDLYLNDYIKRLDFCRDNDCNTVMITGNCEPQQNMQFLKDLGIVFRLMKKPFPIVEIQTTGVFLTNEKLRFLRNHVGVSTVSVSIFSFDSAENNEYRGGAFLDVKSLCDSIKLYDFNLRLSLNLCDHFEKYSPKELLEECQKFGADQVTLRHLYDDGSDTEQAVWTREHRPSENWENDLGEYLKGTPRIRALEYGSFAHDVLDMSVVYDLDCMAKEEKEVFKYLVVRPNGKLYGSWDTKSSLVF